MNFPRNQLVREGRAFYNSSNIAWGLVLSFTQHRYPTAKKNGCTFLKRVLE